jgi:acyl-CoA thioesterase
MTATTSAVTTEFDRTTAPTPIDGHPGEFLVELDPVWASLVGAHGGYMCTIAVRGAESLADDRTVRTITTSFLRTGQIGPATLKVHELRHGRTISTVVADLIQDGRIVITSRMTLLTERPGVEWDVPAPIDLPPPSECERFESTGHVSHFGRVDSRWDPAQMPFFREDDRALIRGHIRPLQTRALDAAWLTMASDWFPPPAFARLTPPTGGVSIDLTTHIHRPHFPLGDGEWLAGEYDIENSSAGLAVERGRIVGPDGTLVVESIQTRLTVQEPQP